MHLNKESLLLTGETAYPTVIAAVPPQELFTQSTPICAAPTGTYFCSRTELCVSEVAVHLL